VVDAQCVQAIIEGLRASSDKSRSTRYLYDKAKALSDVERPKTPEAMIDWVVTTMRNVKVALETASLNGYEYKKPGTSITFAAAIIHRMLAAGRVFPIQMERQRSWQGVERPTQLQLAPGWTNGHPQELRETGRASEKESSQFLRIVGFT
jgi:hypothetical protein